MGTARTKGPGGILSKKYMHPDLMQKNQPSDHHAPMHKMSTMPSDKGKGMYHKDRMPDRKK